MNRQTIGIILNGVTGRMGYRQHLVRSILAIRDEGGLALADGSRIQLRPVLVGRNKDKLQRIAFLHGIDEYTTDLDEALADPGFDIYADFLLTNARVPALRKAMAAGKALYSEKPTAETHAEAAELAEEVENAGLHNGVVHDKLYLPGLLKLKRLVDSGFFGRVLSVRGEFGYWVFEGDWQSSQRPSWNYRAEDGGGIVVDMFPHWNYVFEHLFGSVRSVYAHTATHIPQRVDEQNRTYDTTADDAAYAIFEVGDGTVVQMNSSWCVRVNREELVEFQVDGTHASAVVGLFNGHVQPREITPRPVWNPDLADTHDYRSDWAPVPDNAEYGNGFRAQWEEYLRDYIAGTPHRFDFASAARGVLLAERALESDRTGRRIDLGGKTEAR
ncbi:Gfo/Idh/MocA family oxidoreductase [Nocardiopsis sp. HNM0947]|uniref:Gfo/Idh/MocA family oxidoreductase n=1 Tax=Nocardiopsis coralli TaxID=2772213 RepID=A0ABR9P136_9ACTN|nr:Gfo/Idh/MocA family oxidoreductase [Nocardiopsis coralli]MBE2997544.1 Gfo/Idh/MocA family oxidoreductase [Nocardiopsis coralli]